MCFSSPQWLISRVVYYQASESNLTDNVPTGFDNSTDNIAIVTSSQVSFEICLAKQLFMSPDVMWQSALCNIALCLMHCQWTKGIQVWQFDLFSACLLLKPCLQARCIQIPLEENFKLLCRETLKQNFHALLKICFYFWNRYTSLFEVLLGW